LPEKVLAVYSFELYFNQGGCHKSIFYLKAIITDIYDYFGLSDYCHDIGKNIRIEGQACGSNSVARVSAFQSFITRPHSLFSFLAICVRIHLCPYTYMRDVAKNVANIEIQMSVSNDMPSKGYIGRKRIVG